VIYDVGYVIGLKMNLGWL